MSEQPTVPEFVKNHHLFQDYYLAACLQPHIPLVPEDGDQSEHVRHARAAANGVLQRIRDVWHKRHPHLADNESTVEDFVVEVLRLMAIAVARQGSIRREGASVQRADLVVFADDDSHAYFSEGLANRHPTHQVYAPALAIVEVKPVGTDFAPSGASRHTPAQQLVGYLTHTGVPWGILTDGYRWRLYRRFDPPRYHEYFDINLATILTMPDEESQQEAFWWFYTFFHRDALYGDERPSRVEGIYHGSVLHAIGVQDSLRDQAFQVVEELARGIYATHPTPDDADLGILYEQAIIILFRLLFLKFAEDKQMLPVRDPRYQRYGYAGVETELLTSLDNPTIPLSESSSNCISWMRLQTLFDHLNTGNPEAGIGAYNGGLFRPDRVEEVRIPDAFLARALAHLTRIERDGKLLRVSYRDLETRHLGSIYESLLEQHVERANGSVQLVSTAGEQSNQRRTSGSYYTPDYIVDYMVQQTIDPVCAGKCTEEIAQVRVLDPSMGSGHFLVTALYHLARHHATAKHRELVAPPEQDPEESAESFAERMQEYHVQIAPTEVDIAASERELVEHCIYGVDLNPLAVELAKLALWLSTLASDRALSFLDHHLRVGNSLVGASIAQIGSFATFSPNGNGNGKGKKNNGTRTKKNGNGNGNGTVYQIGLFEQIMWRVRDKILAYFHRIAELPSITPDQIHQKEQEYAHFREYSKPFRQVANLWVSSHFGNSFPNQQAVDVLEALDDLYSDLPDSTRWHAIETQTWFLYAQERADTQEHHFFHWELEFPQVFLRDTKGFDVVIGNPPYVRQEIFKPLKPFFSQVYSDIYHGTADLYVYFLCQGAMLLQQEGRMAYINSNKWFRARYGTKLRTYLPTQVVLEQIIDFGDAPIFADAITYPAILVARRGVAPPDHQFLSLTWKGNRDKLKHFADSISSQSIRVTQSDLTADRWQLVTTDSTGLFTKLRTSGTLLGEYVQERFYTGIKTGLNEAFVVDQTTRNRLIAEHPSSADLLKPFLRGRDVKRWHIEFEEKYLITIASSENVTHAWNGKSTNDAEKIFFSTYPAIAKYLDQYRQALINRYDQGKYYWELRSCAYWQAFDQPKIIIPSIADSVAYAVDENGFYANNKTSICIPGNLYYILGLLNSAPLYWYIQKTASERQGGFFEFIPMYVAALPIPNASEQEQSAIGDLAQQVSKHAQHRYDVQAQGRHRIQSDLGTPGNTLNQKLAQWWTLDFATFRAEIKKAFGRDIPLAERDEWEAWLQSRQAVHTQYTDEIVQAEKAINQQVYRLFHLTDAEVAVIEQETQYQYGK